MQQNMSEWQQNQTYPLLISLWDDQGLKRPWRKTYAHKDAEYPPCRHDAPSTLSHSGLLNTLKSLCTLCTRTNIYLSGSGDLWSLFLNSWSVLNIRSMIFLCIYCSCSSNFFWINELLFMLVFGCKDGGWKHKTCFDRQFIL